MPDTGMDDLLLESFLKKLADSSKASATTASTASATIAQAKQPVQNDKVYTNNCWGNMDYSPLAPTDTLNAKVSPSMATALTGAAIATAIKGPITAAAGLSAAIPPVIVGDLTAGQPSFSLSITGHDGDTYGHLDIFK